MTDQLDQRVLVLAQPTRIAVGAHEYVPGQQVRITELLEHWDHRIVVLWLSEGKFQSPDRVMTRYSDERMPVRVAQDLLFGPIERFSTEAEPIVAPPPAPNAEADDAWATMVSLWTTQEAPPVELQFGDAPVVPQPPVAAPLPLPPPPAGERSPGPAGDDEYEVVDPGSLNTPKRRGRPPKARP